MDWRSIAIILLMTTALIPVDASHGDGTGGHDDCDTDHDGQVSEDEQQQCDDDGGSDGSDQMEDRDRCDDDGDGRADHDEYNDDDCSHWTPGCEDHRPECTDPNYRCDFNGDGYYGRDDMTRDFGCDQPSAILEKCSKHGGGEDGGLHRYSGPGDWHDDDCDRASMGGWSECDVDFDGFLDKEEHSADGCQRFQFDEFVGECIGLEGSEAESCVERMCRGEPLWRFGQGGDFCSNPFRCDTGDRVVTTTDMARCWRDRKDTEADQQRREEAIEEAEQEGKVGGQFAVKDSEDREFETDDGVKVAVHHNAPTLPDGAPPLVKFTLDANLDAGRTFIFDVSTDVIGKDRVKVRYFTIDEESGNETEQTIRKALGLTDILDPDDDEGLPEYWLVSDEDGLHVMVSIGSWSVHSVALEADPESFLERIPIPNLGLTWAVLVLAAMAVAASRKGLHRS